MKTLGLFILLVLCSSAVKSNLRQRERSIRRRSGQYPLVIDPTKQPIRAIPDYVLKIFKRITTSGRSASYNTLKCVFPKIVRTKRAIKVMFNNNSLKEEEKKLKWIGDELRIFMNTSKKSTSNRPYFVKIFDLYSDKKRMVNIYKFSSKDYGWKTINITDWRKDKPPTQQKGRFGLKIVIALGKKKQRINKTAFRKSNSSNEPYFIEFFHQQEEKEKIDNLKPIGLSILDPYRTEYNDVVPKSDFAKRDYFLRERFKIGGRQ